MTPTILYEDNHLLVVIKESGILSQSDITNNIDMLTILKNYLKTKYNKKGNVYLGLVHRLDKDVKGVMVFAKTSKCASRLSSRIRNHQVKKEYVCVCNGIFKEKTGSITSKLERKDYYTIVSPKGLTSTLNYKVICERNNKSLVLIDLITGRHHQIRVQLSSINHEILGDKRYGKYHEHPLALVCYKLSFFHPITKEYMTFKIDKPKNGYFKLFTDINL